MESVVPSNERGPETDAELMVPPLPIKIPPSVVDPVPPNGTESVVEPTTLPLASVVRMEEVMLVKRFERTVRLVVEAFAKYELDDAMMPCWNQNGVVVACVVVP